MSLVGWWKLDGDATDAMGKNDGTNNGVSFVDGKLGQAGDFDGSSWINIGDMGNPTQGTISLWFKKDNTNTEYLMDGRSDGNWWFLTHYNGHDINFYNNVVWDGLNLNEWYHVVVTATPDKTEMYINGNLVDTGGGLALDLSSVRMGTRYTNESYLNGQLDDVRIYDHALSTKKIKELSKAKVAHWKFDQNNPDILERTDTLDTGSSTPHGIGYDPINDYVICTDNSPQIARFEADTLSKVDDTSVSWASSYVIGVVYDSDLDIFWMMDWDNKDIVKVDPSDFSELDRYNVPSDPNSSQDSIGLTLDDSGRLYGIMRNEYIGRWDKETGSNAEWMNIQSYADVNFEGQGIEWNDGYIYIGNSDYPSSDQGKLFVCKWKESVEQFGELTHTNDSSGIANVNGTLHVSSREDTRQERFHIGGYATDVTGNGNNGTLKGVGYTQDSKIGEGAYDFKNDDDYIDVPDNNSYLDGFDEFTASYWLIPDDSINYNPTIHAENSTYDSSYNVEDRDGRTVVRADPGDGQGVITETNYSIPETNQVYTFFPNLQVSDSSSTSDIIEQEIINNDTGNVIQSNTIQANDLTETSWEHGGLWSHVNTSTNNVKVRYTYLAPSNVTLWADYQGVRTYRSVIDKGGSYLLRFYGGNPRINLANSSGDGCNVWGNSVNANEPVHVVVTWDGSTVRVYQNGNETGSGSLSGPMALNSNNVKIGDTSMGFGGVIDDVRIYGTALDQSEVEQLYEQRASLDDKGNVYSHNISEGYQEHFSGGEVDSEWTLNNAYFKTDYSRFGNYSIGSDGQGEISATLEPPHMSGGKKISSFEYWWWEESSQTGHRVTLRDSDGNDVMYSETENPQWILSDGTGESTIRGYDGQGYNVWTKFTFEFNWEDGTYDYHLNTINGDYLATGTLPLNSTKDVEQIVLHAPTGSGNYNRFDGFKVDGNEFSVDNKGIINPYSINEVGPGSDSLVGYWKLDGDTKDYSGNQNHGTNNGATITGGLGQSAYEFDGSNDYIEVPDDLSLDITGEITVSHWIKLPSGDYTHMGYVGKNHYGDWYTQTGSGGDPQFRVTDTSNNTYKASAGGDIRDNQWHHMVGTYDGSEIKIYLDGNHKGTNSIELTMSTNSDPVIVGDRQNKSSHIIQDIRLYDRALSAEEIETLYNITNPNQDQRMIQRNNGVVYTKGEFKETL